MNAKLTTLLLAFAALTSHLSMAAEPAPAKKGAKSETTKAEAKTGAKKTETPKPTDKEEAEAITKALTPTQKTKLLEILNKGDDTALTSLPGVGERRAVAIKKARPFAAPSDLVSVKGIGKAGLADIVAHAKAGFPAATKPDSAKKPVENKPEASKSKSKAKAKSPEEPKKGK